MASLVDDPEQIFALKVFKKQILKSKKEYRKKKSGHGMEVYTQLMKV